MLILLYADCAQVCALAGRKMFFGLAAAMSKPEAREVRQPASQQEGASKREQEQGMDAHLHLRQLLVMVAPLLGGTRKALDRFQWVLTPSKRGRGGALDGGLCNHHTQCKWIGHGRKEEENHSPSGIPCGDGKNPEVWRGVGRATWDA